MTTEQFWYIVSKQKEWAEMYKMKQQDKLIEFRRINREYQEIRRRQLGRPIRFPKNT